ncbi:hypothetical protein BHM03_00006791 [Ensete ventricosum]|uniref:Cwf15/Cwc15 cell cycle control protein n=1 Tax=Ensete ventricosum TaxID=4639 RepID=A0A427A0D4_ENSVE|nr:hypothetical protein B296_00005268 [Ensete ventricosum]RZR80709.1 hypothetical protein BHM03_00006791 [Ensete ventricosum]
MTTAARPTWAPAKGGNEQGGTRIFGPSQKYSSRDLASHTNLKPRKEGQDTHDELQRRNLREELEERERRHFSSKDKSYAGNACDEDEDDTEALLAELERIKKERAEEKLRKFLVMHQERQQQEEELKAKEAELMRGNPLINLNNSATFSVKRRWDDDVVFKNQARGETKVPKRFINDTIRNDFHRKFLQKYMK